VASIYCRSTSVDPPAERPERPVPEQEADAFAAALLMPASLMREHYTQCRDDFPGQARFLEMCRRFGTSNAAMGRRMHAVI
jgi:Zn-dependent peptidase ImmA (M78 family)